MDSSGSRTRWATREELEVELARLEKIADKFASVRMQKAEIEAILTRLDEEEENAET